MIYRGLLFTIISIFAFCTSSYSQHEKLGCRDKNMRIQAEQAKQDFKAQGLEIFKDAMITMSSKDPFPIAVQLTEKQLYQILFIGSTSATKLYFELFDGKDQKIAEKTIDDPSRNNFMIYSFIPSKSDVYLIILSQKTKGKKEVCGSLTIMQKANVKQENTPD